MPRVLLTLAALVILIAGLREAESVIVPFLLSVFLSMLAIPILAWLRRHRVPQPLAIVLVVLGLIVILVAIGVVVGGSINGFTQALPQYQARMTSLISSIDRQLRSWGLDVSISAVGDLINPGQVFQLAGGLLSRLAGIVSNFFLVVLTTVFILTEASGFPRKIQIALGDRGSGLLNLSGVMTQVHRYLVIKTAISLMTGVILGTWVWILGVDFPVLWGLLTFLLNYIPNLGSIMAAVPPVLLALIQPGGGLTVAIMVAVGYITVNVGFRQCRRTPRHGTPVGTVDACGVSLSRLLGMGLGRRRHVAFGPPDDGGQDHAGEQFGTALDCRPPGQITGTGRLRAAPLLSSRLRPEYPCATLESSTPGCQGGSQRLAGP